MRFQLGKYWVSNGRIIDFEATKLNKLKAQELIKFNANNVTVLGKMDLTVYRTI